MGGSAAADKPRDEALLSPRASFRELQTPDGGASTGTKGTPSDASDGDFGEDPSPLDSANWLSFATLWWLHPLLRRGFAAPLTEKSVYQLPLADKSHPLQRRFDAAWAAQERKARARNAAAASGGGGGGSDEAVRVRPNINAALWHATKEKIGVALVMYALSASLTLFQPLVIKSIIEFIDGEANMFGISSGYGLALLLGASAVCGATFINLGQFMTARAGCNARMVVINSVYQKILRLSATARRTMNSGEVVTLAGVDSERVLEAYSIGLWCVISPTMLVAVCVLLGWQMGVYVALGAAVTSVAIIYGAFLTSKHIGLYRRRISRVSANRVKLTNEVLQGIRVIKYYAWEDSINDTIRQIREEEVSLMRRYNLLRLSNAVLMFLAPTFLNLVCFLIYILLGHTLDVATAFVVLALTNACKMAFSIFANASVAVSEAMTSTKRFSDFLVSDEVGTSNAATDAEADHNDAVGDKDATPVISIRDAVGDKDATPVISIRDADFRWVDSSAAPTLSGISLTIAPGTLTVIVGPVGSGKSSLVNAILGEMQQVRGSRAVRGSFAYSSQQAWIQNQTVRDNILFGAPLDEARYAAVVAACQLLPDLEMLEQGDETEIGERGINLSGGQKARVGIARAMYRAEDFDFVVLDDPLSALDVHVANAVFSLGLQGIAQHKTRVLVLNSHYHLLQYADRILVMRDGRIAGDGTLAELQAEFPHLASSPRRRKASGEDFSTDEDSSEESGKEPASPAQPTVEKAASKSRVADEAAAGKPEGTPEGTPEGKPKGLITQEDREVGSVSLQTYVNYFATSGWNGVLVATTILLLFGLAQVALFFADWFLSRWSKGAVDLSQDASLGVYVGIVAAAFVLATARCVYYMLVCMKCSENLHLRYLRKVLGAPVTTFFDVTPVGRILNRFSRDLDQVDNPMPYFSLWMVMYVFQMASAFVVCAAADPWVLLLYLPVGYGLVFIIRVYQASAREVKRLDSVTRSPFLNLVSETISGIETIRSFRMTAFFSARSEQLLNHNAKFFFVFQSSGRWFAMRTDWLISLIICAVAVLAVATRASLGAAVAGLGLTYAAQLTSSFQRMTNLVTQVENIMTCFERISHYDSLPEEGCTRTPTGSAALDAAWPRSGAVAFEGVVMRYRDELPAVLKGVSFQVASGEKVGICGRTGSGKSSLMSVLFRVVECARGRVLIDGVDISTISLHQLRTKLTIIPQDPMLFSGSLRMNLDPFALKSDDELFAVLRRVHLSDAVAAWGRGLDYEVAEKGENLSVGQRQLVCIARALIRDSKVIVMDEATANVDKESDRLIQQTVKESFGGGDQTVLCIAHRLETIMDSDKILVLDAGEVVEFDTPDALLAKPTGIFQSLVDSAKSVGTLA